MPGPTRRRGVSQVWHWLWRDASRGERIVVIVAALAILVAIGFAVNAAFAGGPVCRCGP